MSTNPSTGTAIAQLQPVKLPAVQAAPAVARTDPPAADHARSLRRSLAFGLGAITLFGGTVGLWAATSTLSGAVVASGQFVVDTNVKKVQHATGGVVGELRVREGAHVNEGDLLIRLDETLTKANLQVLVKQLDEFAARGARLEAERDLKPKMADPADSGARMIEPEFAKLVAAERSLFDARRAARDGQRGQLGKRVGQLRDEITGLRAQQTAEGRQSTLITDELVGVRNLYRQNLVPLTRLNALEREAAQLEGRRGQLVSAVAQAEGKIAETELQILQLDQDLRSESMKELREIQGKSAELIERRVAAEDQLRRVDIRAPSSGFVHQLTVHTVGGVITPAEPAMLIVPENELLQLEARVAPQDIDQLAVGQAALVRLHAFNQRTTPELTGRVERISADVTREAQTGIIYYTMRVALSEDEIKRLEGLRLVAGMQAEVFVQTAERTPFEYLVKPLKDQMQRAFRER